MKTKTLKSLICATIAAGSLSSGFAAIVFEDDFTVDPAAGGWTEDADGGSITHNGTYAVFSGGNNSTQTITRTISTVGGTGLYVSFDFTTQGGAEGNDSFTFLIDSDNDSTFESVAQTPADGTSISNADPVALPTAGENNSSLPVRMAWSHNFGGEDGLLDRLELFEAPDVITTDPFDLDPGANGWTEAGGSVTSNGLGQASLQGTPTSSITKTFDLSDYETVLVLLDGENDGFNDDNDAVIASIDTGSGFVEVASQNGTASPYLLSGRLPESADRNASVDIRLTVDSTAGGQHTLFDQLTLRGKAIPEPSSLLLLTGLLAVRLRRRPLS